MINELSAMEFAILLAVVYLVSYLSYKFVEQPARERFALRSLKIQAVGLAVAIIVAILFSNLMHTLPPAAFFDVQKSSLLLGSKEERKLPEGNAVIGKIDGKIEFLLFGDSHAQAIVPAISQLASDRILQVERLLDLQCPCIIAQGLMPVTQARMTLKKV